MDWAFSCFHFGEISLLCAERPLLRTMARIQNAISEKAFSSTRIFESSANIAAWYTVGTSSALITVLRGNTAVSFTANDITK